MCDFWFASRQRRGDLPTCEGLRSLARFRDRGGALTILVGNHDLWLGPFYERALGATLAAEPLVVEAYGKRLRLVHGHRNGGRLPWKTAMESRAFLAAFAKLPGPVATRLDRMLDHRNLHARARDDARHVAGYRRLLGGIDPTIDIAVFGHVHTPLDDPTSRPRLIILGGWHDLTCYLRLDEAGATHVVEPSARPVTA